MPTDLATLAIAVDSRQVRRSTTDLQRLSAQAPPTERATARLQRGWARLRSTGSSLSAQLVTMRGAFVALGGAMAVRQVVRFSDAWTEATNRLRVAGLSGEGLTTVMDALVESAQANAAPIEALVELYSRAALVQNELGVSSKELLTFTDRVSQALRISGRSASESSGALLQLSQALGSGVVRAEEFNSILEGALPIAQAAARGLDQAGGSVAKLRQLVIDGKVSSDAFFRAFMRGSREFGSAIDDMDVTVSQGFTRIDNALTRFVGEAARVSTASATVGEGLSSIAGGIDAVTAKLDAFARFVDEMDRLGGLLEQGGAISAFLSGPLGAGLSVAQSFEEGGSSSFPKNVLGPGDAPPTVAAANAFDEAAAAAAKAEMASENFWRATTSINEGAKLELLTDTVRSFGDAASFAFTEAIVGGEKLSDTLSGLAEDLQRIALNAVFRQLFSQLIGQPSAAGQAPSGLLGALSGAAQGAAIRNGRVMPMARGGVIDRPILFPMARGMGLAGEAGPEAVLPLRRGPGGDLGVGAPKVEINVETINQSSGARAETKQSRGPNGEVLIRTLVRDEVSRGIAQGKFDNPMAARFGQRPKGVSR